MTEKLKDASVGGDEHFNWTSDTERLDDSLEVKTTRFSDGVTVQHVIEGETIIKRLDGSILTLNTDGSIRIRGADGQIREISEAEIAKTKINLADIVHEARKELDS